MIQKVTTIRDLEANSFVCFYGSLAVTARKDKEKSCKFEAC